MDFLKSVFNAIVEFFVNIIELFSGADSLEHVYTTAARWVFIVLALFVLLRSIMSLLKSKNPSEVWAYFHLQDGTNIPITHWENVIGRARSCDIRVEDMSVSRNHGILTRGNSGKWTYTDLGSKNGAMINGIKAAPNVPSPIDTGDELLLGGTLCTLFPVSIEERMNNVKLRKADTSLLSPWSSIIAITIFQVMTVIQLKFSLGKEYTHMITASFAMVCAVMWIYVIALRVMKRKGFEIEIIAFFLSTMSLAVMSSRFPDQVFKQAVSVVLGVTLFFMMCAMLRNLKRTVAMKWLAYAAAAVLLLINLIFGVTKNGSANWIEIGGISMQPSEIVKLAFIWVGAATMDELFRKKNSMIFTGFTAFCFLCLAKMGDFGTALIFFATFLIISYLRSGDFTKLIGIAGVAFAGGLIVISFKSYVADRFAVWGHAWENADGAGYQATCMMIASASGGLIGVGAGNGWLNTVFASETDIVFGLITEEWGLIIAVMLVLSIVTLSIFAYRSIWAGRSTYYTIAACAATTIFLLQTILNVFGSCDLLPFTGVTFPFVSCGGTSMIASWGLLAFLKAADTRQNASIAVSLKDKGVPNAPGDADILESLDEIDTFSDEDGDGTGNKALFGRFFGSGKAQTPQDRSAGGSKASADAAGSAGYAEFANAPQGDRNEHYSAVDELDDDPSTDEPVKLSDLFRKGGGHS